jgi:hypothetical protein
MKRRVAVHITGQADFCGVKAGRDLDPRLFFLVHDRFDLHGLFEDSAAPAVDIAHGGTDLGISVGVDILDEKVDQPTLTLQYRQKLHCSDRQ